MAELTVSNEGDMEYSLAYTLKLAKVNSECKIVRIVFSTEGMMEIFIKNLFEDFIVNSIPCNNGLDLYFMIPEEYKDDNK